MSGYDLIAFLVLNSKRVNGGSMRILTMNSTQLSLPTSRGLRSLAMKLLLWPGWKEKVFPLWVGHF